LPHFLFYFAVFSLARKTSLKRRSLKQPSNPLPPPPLPQIQSRFRFPRRWPSLEKTVSFT
jgi:hypothetical protein